MFGTRDASCVVECNDLAPDVVYDSLLITVVVLYSSYNRCHSTLTRTEGCLRPSRRWRFENTPTIFTGLFGTFLAEFT